jgi:hypothetical protein
MQLYQPNVAQEYKEDIDPTGYLMMEKYGGVRVYWDGSTLLSQYGDVPQDQLNCEPFPSMPFEGQLWYQIFAL